MKKVFLLLAVLGVGVWGYINLPYLKNLFIASPLSQLYVTYFRDGPLIDKDHVVTKLDNGMSIIVNRHDRCVCWFVRLTGHWDSNEKKVLDRLVQKGSTVVEVGANFGVHTLQMADLVGEKGRIIAVEANPNVSRYLKKSVALNRLENRVDVLEMAVSNSQYKGFMTYNEQNIGGGYILPNTQETKQRCMQEKCQPIHVTLLDTVLGNAQVNLLKIDAEGAEYWILQGAPRLLKQPGLILMMEHDPKHLHRNQIDLRAFLGVIQNAGFTHVYAVSLGGSIQEITFKNLEDPQSRDIILAKGPLPLNVLR
jgi:FkbM family methyltransferase